MSEVGAPEVHDLVGFMASFDPRALRELQQRYPGQPVLQPGRRLGQLTASAAVRLELALAGLHALSKQGDALTDRLAGRIRSSHRIELLAQLMAAFGSGSLLVLVLGEGSTALQLAGALLALFGSVTSIVVKFLRRDLAGAENGLVAQHQALVQLLAQALQVAAQLRPFELAHDDLEEPAALRALIEQANTLAGRMYQQFKQAGVRVAVTEVMA